MATLSPLIGRAEELGLVEKLVQEHRLVTVTGAAGVGKTRLVEELRAQLAAAGDRVISIRLDHLPAGAGAAAIAGEAGMSSPEALALATTGERIVIVLDGCDHVLEGAMDVALRFFEATDTGAVLTTSRQPLGVAGERVVVLEPLGLPTPADPDPAAAPAVALFFELVTASDARWDRSDRTVQAVADALPGGRRPAPGHRAGGGAGSHAVADRAPRARDPADRHPPPSRRRSLWRAAQHRLVDRAVGQPPRRRPA